jgi:rhodanese-related sulfurtransferase
VRESHEVEQGSIPSATVLPLTVLPSAIVLPPDQFLKTYGFEKPGKNKEIIFYCRSGKRAATACETARNNGYTKCVESMFGERLAYTKVPSVSGITKARGLTGSSGNKAVVVVRLAEKNRTRTRQLQNHGSDLLKLSDFCGHILENFCIPTYII